MRKIVALLVGLAALAAFVRLLRAGGRAREAHQPYDPRAGALREKLADSRRALTEENAAPVPPAVPAPGLDPAQPATSPPGPAEPAEPATQTELEVEAARRQVYEEGRAALEEMRRSGEL